MANEGDLSEYGRGQANLPSNVPQPLVTDNGRPALTIVQLLERVGQDTRMGRGTA